MSPWRAPSLLVLLVLLVLPSAGCTFIPASDSTPQPGVGFAFGASLTDESVGTHQVAVELSAPWHELVTVNVGVSGGSAEPSADYRLETAQLTFFPGDTLAAISLVILGDGVAEPDETIELRLTNPDGAVIAAGAHTVTISANVLPRVSFTSAETAAPEAQVNQTFMVALTAVSPVDVVVGYAVGGTAALGADHTLTTGMIVIPAGQTTRPLPLTVKDDNIDEDDETVEITLTALSGAVVGEVPAVVHTIANDDPPAVATFALAASSTDEGGPAAQVVVKLTPESGKVVMVEYAVAEGGTAAATDYTISTAPLVFMPGVTERTITLTPVNDQLDEDDMETVNVALTTASNATLGTQAAHVWSILDNDPLPVLQFAVDSSSTPESGIHLVRVNLAPVSGRAVQFSIQTGTVPLTFPAGSQDYTVGAGPYTIAAGATQVDIPIVITDDSQEEMNERFRLTLVTPVNATLGNRSAHIVTIIDDDD